MIGFNALGQMGRFGNQMFQFAALKGIAKNNGYDYCIPPSNNLNEWVDHQLFVPFELKCISSQNIQYIDFNKPVVVESNFSFDEKIFNDCPDNVDLRGYFQSEKYFKHIRNELLEDFKFKSEILDPCKEIIHQFDKPPISLHVRRTDYITNPNHTVLNVSYYEKALEKFKSQDVLVFSDDPEWCKEQELFSDDRFLISEGNSNYVDLCLMTLCSGHIIANSSFSWWGAWLSDSEKIIAPSGWFEGSANEHLNTEDIYCPEWVIL